MYKFFTAVLRNEFNRPKWLPIVNLLKKINRTLEVILGGGIVAGLVYLIYQYVPMSDHKRWTAIGILTGLLLLAMWLLGAVKRFHESTISEVTLDHEGTLAVVKKLYKGVIAEIDTAQEQTRRELDHMARLIEYLTLLEGRSDALYFVVENRSWNDHPLAGIPLHKDEIKYHEADIYNTFRDRLGSEEVEKYFQRLGAVPEKLYEQKSRIEAHRYQLHQMLQSDRADRLQITTKAAVQKQETLKRIG